MIIYHYALQCQTCVSGKIMRDETTFPSSICHGLGGWHKAPFEEICYVFQIYLIHHSTDEGRFLELCCSIVCDRFTQEATSIGAIATEVYAEMIAKQP
ncbi:hypothetical protein CDAR_478851 [Caerostris darwini]|uniref:Uncharacterized protein n=1 Tax=Caerostris darwini TaxID=1538125 RepID=A0AAV4RR79_9ARAC|nr:hypothetical protein CDAR_478851 [Caerostris darwini]